MNEIFENCVHHLLLRLEVNASFIPILKNLVFFLWKTWHPNCHIFFLILWKSLYWRKIRNPLRSKRRKKQLCKLELDQFEERDLLFLQITNSTRIFLILQVPKIRWCHFWDAEEETTVTFWTGSRKQVVYWLSHFWGRIIRRRSRKSKIMVYCLHQS